MKVAQHFSAGLAFKRLVRPVRDDRNGRIVSFMSARGRTHPMVYRPYRDASLLIHQPTTEVLGYFHWVPPGPIFP
jgi:hypothetical protein